MTITTDNRRINAQTWYDFSYSVINLHTTSTSIEVQIPSGFGIDTITCDPGPELNIGMDCSISNSVVTLTNVLLDEIAAGSKISFRINGLQNPSASSALQAWVLTSKDG